MDPTADTQPAKAAIPTVEGSVTPDEVFTTTLTPIPLSPIHSAPPPGPIPQYILKATLDYGRHHLAVEEQIQYTNHTPDSLPDLLLMVEPARYPGCFELKSLSWDEGQPVDGITWEGPRLRLPLRQPLKPGEQVGLSISYTLDLPSPVPSPTTRPVPFGYNDQQTNLVDWYPFIPPYLPGQGWLAHDPGYFGEHLVHEDSDFQVELQLLGDGTTAATEPNQETGPAYRGQPIVLAASAPAEKEGEIYRYRLESARSFALSASEQYQVAAVRVGAVTVTGYSFAIHSRAGEAALKTTAQALELYQKLYGPYPYKSLSVVEADFLDGMEYDGLYFLSNGFYNLYHGTPGEYLIAIAAHETAHQWWYGLVGNDQALEPWLDEALCTYSERLFFENLHPEALDWWWAYRVKYYDPRGPVDGSIYNPGGYRPYRDAVYLNGAMFLEDLRKAVGDEAFFAFMKDYAGRYSHKIATGKDFFAVLAEHSSADISGLLKTYFQKDPRGD